jgi:hypothetical protein
LNDSRPRVLLGVGFTGKKIGYKKVLWNTFASKAEALNSKIFQSGIYFSLSYTHHKNMNLSHYSFLSLEIGFFKKIGFLKPIVKNKKVFLVPFEAKVFSLKKL